MIFNEIVFLFVHFCLSVFVPKFILFADTRMLSEYRVNHSSVCLRRYSLLRLSVYRCSVSL